MSSPLTQVIELGVCSDTVAGWLWYCDAHDTHGNGDSRAEVEVVSDAHVDFHEDGTGEACAITIWQRATDDEIDAAEIP